jgi:type I restriction enzyme S subunit
MSQSVAAINKSARWKLYSAYKDSGVEWLGQIPKHWKIEKLKRVSDVAFSSVDKHTLEGEIAVRLCNYVDVYKNDSITQGMEFMTATATPSEKARFELHKNDVLVTKDSEEWTDIAVPSYVCTDMPDVLCGYHLAHIRPHRGTLDGKYLSRSFRAHGISDQFKVESTGVTRYGLGKYSLDNSLFVVPPINEQQAIATFLDRETARIDALIEKKQRQIDLLQEKRAAFIIHAVTKGLDSSARMKDSGVERIGEIPEYWEIKRVKRIASLRSGESITALEIEGNGEYPVYGGNGLRGYISSYTHEGDFVLIGRQGALCGCVNYAKGRFWASEHAVVVSPKEKSVVNWLGELLRSMNLNQYSQSAAQPGLAVETIADLQLPVPPQEEQYRIAEYLKDQTSRLDRVLAVVLKSLKTLGEYRLALISAAVIGKIDVRGEISNA